MAARTLRSHYHAPPRKYLCCVDEGTLLPLQHALRFLRPEDELICLTLFDDEKKRGTSNQIVQLMEDQIRADGTKAKYRVLASAARDLGRYIVQFAEAEDIDYIVMGTRGLSPLRKMVNSSVSEYVVKAASCPVMIARPVK